MAPRTIFRHPDICFFPPPLGPTSGVAVASSPQPRSMFPRHPSWLYPAHLRLHAGVPMLAHTIAPRARICSSCPILLEASWNDLLERVDKLIRTTTDHLLRTSNIAHLLQIEFYSPTLEQLVQVKSFWEIPMETNANPVE